MTQKKPKAALSPASAPTSVSVGERDDVVVLGPPTEDGGGVGVVRFRNGQVEAGQVRPLEHGKPLHQGEVVRLVPREGCPQVCDVKVDLELPAPKKRAQAGPAQVATRRYRENWDAIWKKKPKAEDAPS